jgi:thiol-disulfide isomerase/thioredoxin
MPIIRSLRALALASVIAVAGLAVSAAAAHAGGDWNDSAIQWRGYEEGLAAAKKEKKPICLIFFTEWCPHCTRYSGVFHDPKVVEKAKSFVMIRLDKDKNAELSAKHKPDGEYIPRTYFLSPAGEFKADIHAPRDKYQYFYNEADPAELLASMDTALKKVQ